MFWKREKHAQDKAYTYFLRVVLIAMARSLPDESKDKLRASLESLVGNMGDAITAAGIDQKDAAAFGDELSRLLQRMLGALREWPEDIIAGPPAE